MGDNKIVEQELERAEIIKLFLVILLLRELHDSPKVRPGFRFLSLFRHVSIILLYSTADMTVRNAEQTQVWFYFSY